MANNSISIEEQLQTFRRKEEERFVKYLSKKINIPLAGVTVDVEPDAIRLIPEEDARMAEVATVQIYKKIVTLLVRNINNPNLKKIEKILTDKGFEIKKLIATLAILERTWTYYADLSTSTRTMSGVIDISASRVADLTGKIKTIEDVDKVFYSTPGVKDYQASRSLEVILSAAFALGASDIHLESNDEGGVVRYRIHGILRLGLELDKKFYKLLISRLKLFSGLKVNIITEAQDGRFSIDLHDGNDIEVRTSTVPEGGNESIVMRILDSRKALVDVGDLGLHPSLAKVFNEQIRKPNGMIITTGPTGSGKTTTLYSFLKAIYTPRIKIITLENPVEYKLPGIVQTQINKDYSFTQGLRASLRQDPDVILVGEIRDEEVAKVAIDAALTGHVVFSTLHTNDAAGALPRLEEMGADPKTLGAAMNLIIAQRLVRKVDQSASKTISLNEEQKKLAMNIINSMPETIKQEALSLGFDSIYQPDDDDGYKSRMGIYEAIIVDDNIIKSMLSEGSEGGVLGIKEAAKAQNLMTLEQDCLLKVLNGITSLSEMERIVGTKIL